MSGRGKVEEDVSGKQEQKAEKRERTGERLQWLGLLLRKEKEKIGPGRLPENWVNHQKIAGTTWVCTNTGSPPVPDSSLQLSFTVQEVQARTSGHVAPIGTVKMANGRTDLVDLTSVYQTRRSGSVTRARSMPG